MGEIASYLLDLPREVRDTILIHLLSNGEAISIICAGVPPPDAGGNNLEAEDSYTLAKSTVRGRSTWNSPTDGVVWHDNPPMTYEAHSDCYGLLNLGIMLVSRQMYEESNEIFYAKNTFRFVDDFRIPTACIFLEDRTQKTLSFMRSVEIALMETEDRGLGGDEYNSHHGGNGGPFWLRFAFHHFSRLCTLLASPSMRLSHLGICYETGYSSFIPPVFLNQPPTVDDWLSFEREITVGIPSWLDPLLSVTNLDTITLACTSRRPMFRRQALMGRAMRQRMLKPSTSNQMSAQFPLDVVKFKTRLGSHDDDFEEQESKNNEDCEILYKISTEEVEVRTCLWRNGELDIFAWGRDDNMPRNEASIITVLFRDSKDTISVLEISS